MYNLEPGFQNGNVEYRSGKGRISETYWLYLRISEIYLRLVYSL